MSNELTNRQTLYRAITRRDSRFDGRVYVAVKSTGIYCRPSCPSRRPRRENVDFFADARAAEAAGFRACKRCLPDGRTLQAFLPGGASTSFLSADKVGTPLDFDAMVKRLGAEGK